jgi:hypothetical protein
MHFEEAQKIKELKCLELPIAFHNHKSKITNIDVFSIVSESCLREFFTNFPQIIRSHTMEIKKNWKKQMKSC